jgi:hypothetical protein
MKITLQTTGLDGAAAYKVDVDGKKIKFLGGSGSVDAAPGAHVLHWYVEAAPNTQYTLEITSPASLHFKYPGTIDSDKKDAGLIWFTVPEGA